MKNNKVLIIVGVILINILVAFVIGQSLMGKESEFDIAISQARDYVQKDLCSKAIGKYNEALSHEENLETRIEMLGVYEKGIGIGEFSASYDLFTFATDMTENYREDPRAYETACEFLLKYGKYEDCAEVLMKARDLYVTSEKIEEYREQIRYQYTKYYSMYTEIQPMYDGLYRAATDGFYTYLNQEGSGAVGGGYLQASSFAYGYAFVKSIQPDGEERSYIINKNGQRQCYLNGVESSSGVGKGFDSNGVEVYLLSCKVGEKYKYYTLNGNEAFGEYDFAGRFRNNIAAVKTANGKWQFINATGTLVSNDVFEDVILNDYDECAPKGVVIAKKNDKYHIYDSLLNQIGEFACDGAKPFVEDYFAFKNGELWGFASASGEIIIPAQYNDAKSFSTGIGGVKIGEKWNFVNAKNEIVIKETFDDVDYLNSNGVCFVKKDGYWSYLKMYYTGR